MRKSKFVKRASLSPALRKERWTPQGELSNKDGNAKARELRVFFSWVNGGWLGLELRPAPELQPVVYLWGRMCRRVPSTYPFNWFFLCLCRRGKKYLVRTLMVTQDIFIFELCSNLCNLRWTSVILKLAILLMPSCGKFSFIKFEICLLKFLANASLQMMFSIWP